MPISFLEALLWALTGLCFLLIFVLEFVARYKPAGDRQKERVERVRPTAARQPAATVAASSPAPAAAAAEGQEAPVSAEPMQIKRLRQAALERQEKRIGEILLSQGFITRADLDKALEDQQRYGGSVTQHLLHAGRIDEKQLAQCLSSQFKVPYLPVGAYEISRDIVESIPVDIAEKYWVMPVDRQGDALMVAMIDPLDKDLIRDLEKLTGMEIIPFVGIISEIIAALRLYYKVLSKDDVAKIMKNPPFFIDTKTYTGLERRKTIRYRSKIDIRFPLADTYVATQTTDVSRGGFSFASQGAVELGTMLTLEVNLPREVSPLPISVVVQVVRCVPQREAGFQIGVKTLKISRTENNLIVGYAARHREEGVEPAPAG
ncbi:MAG: PilZ domain-containing protein [Deltaproteobacteria bacterium]